jgi:hypothetical protein
MSCCRESKVGRSGQRIADRAEGAVSQAPQRRDSDAGRSQQGWDGRCGYALGHPGRDQLANRMPFDDCLRGNLRKRLEALHETAAHVGAGLCATGTGVIAGQVVRAGGHGRHIGLRRCQRDARRDGNERHHHGEDAKGHEPTVQSSLHTATLPQREDGDKNWAACLLISALHQRLEPVFAPSQRLPMLWL